MPKGLANIKQLNRPGWQWRVTTRNRDVLPPTAKQYATVMAIVRSLLVHIPEAVLEYESVLLPMAKAVSENGGGLPEISELTGDVLADALMLNTLIQDYLQQMDAAYSKSERQVVRNFVGRFLLRSELAADCVGERMAFDVLGVDLVELQAAWEATNPLWDLLHSTKPTTVAGRKARTTLNSYLEDWSPLHDDDLMATAKIWVEVNIAFEGRLSDWIAANTPDGGRPLQDDISKVSARLRPLDKEIGKQRHKGRPPRFIV